MDFYWQRAKLLANVGGKNRFGVMYLDYRGYGLSEGVPIDVYIWLVLPPCVGGASASPISYRSTPSGLDLLATDPTITSYLI